MYYFYYSEREPKCFQGDIVVLEETHLTYTTLVKLFSPTFQTWHYSLLDVSKTIGFGFHKGTSFTLETSLVDDCGRYIFIKGTLGNLPCTLANIYAPNRDQAEFLSPMLSNLKDFAHGCIILSGDSILLWNP